MMEDRERNRLTRALRFAKQGYERSHSIFDLFHIQDIEKSIEKYDLEYQEDPK
jgi:hypothetical protein